MGSGSDFSTHPAGRGSGEGAGALGPRVGTDSSLSTCQTWLLVLCLVAFTFWDGFFPTVMDLVLSGAGGHPFSETQTEGPVSPGEKEELWKEWLSFHTPSPDETMLL